MLMEPTRTSFQSPWQNGVAERLVGTVRRELLDHVIVLNERRLRQPIESFVAYYNEDRTHRTSLVGLENGRVVSALEGWG
jgi:transposase InsO family protein